MVYDVSKQHIIISHGNFNTLNKPNTLLDMDIFIQYLDF